MEQLKGVVDRITYANEESGYSVIKVSVKGYQEPVAVLGNMASVCVGSVVLVKGRWLHNPKYGRQFEAVEWEESYPASVYGIEKYLGSGLIKGIGPIYAKKIVHRYQENTMTILEEEPERLLEIEGIGHKRVDMIKKAWEEQKEVKNIMLFLQSHGISTAFGSRIYKTYGNDSIPLLKENPYRLADDIYGIGFKTADMLAKKLGIDPGSSIRCRSGIIYVLSRFADEGHCYAPFETLLAKTAELLEMEEGTIREAIAYLVQVRDLIQDEDAYYLPPLFYSETGVAKRLMEIAVNTQEKECGVVFGKVDGTDKAIYDPIQEKAIQMALTNKVMVLTGGPGTGKTTTVKGIISRFLGTKQKVLLAAPTGRAAKRLSETTGMEAKTIHRLLEVKPPQGYMKNEENRLDGDVLIVDEASMIDILLMYNLLKAVPDPMRVIFVGDVDQLPSVGPGNVLKDIIASGTIPVVTLKKIFRQAKGSQIITNAHRIKEGHFPELQGGKNANFFFIEEKEHMVERIVELCAKRLPKYYQVDPIKDIQVLSPMQRTETGAIHLNSMLQDALNTNSITLQRGATQYRLHDKVMQLRNNYDKDIFNGDVGYICHIDVIGKTLKVLFDGREVAYEHTELDELTLAYATTIHKAQGSEYPIVVIPITFSHYMMLQRNLLYTGITRAAKVAVLVGEKRAIYAAVMNAEVKKRNTRLCDRLQRIKNPL